ncbi:alcohol dehydrogenase catalytic domain-containing protein [Oceanobacillus rekensis]|uniref:alcohol dehydrogenase catalytic domain-containing protein n=1 Tax=Oceanobacillus rekensis TaxID=937927 RepID=UPI000B42FE1B
MLICGSDLHLYRSTIPLNKDCVIAHEPLGIVEKVSPGVKQVKKGKRAVIIKKRSRISASLFCCSKFKFTSI